MSTQCLESGNTLAKRLCAIQTPNVDIRIQAFEEWYQSEKKVLKVWKTIRGRVQNREDADEIHQDTCAAVFHNILHGTYTYNHEKPAEFDTYVVEIAKHKIAALYKKPASHKTVSLEDLTEEGDIAAQGLNWQIDSIQRPTELEVERMLDSTKLASLLARLPDRNREILQMEINGYTPDEIAELLGVNLGNIRVLKHRAMQRIKQLV